MFSFDTFRLSKDESRGCVIDSLIAVEYWPDDTWYSLHVFDNNKNL